MNRAKNEGQQLISVYAALISHAFYDALFYLTGIQFEMFFL